ncbi:MAG TPA: Uma2 family endonuclease [Candidatus Hodarchaeales archaeon]|nr:Uma2 family endonuclease [Candidatus Hodarchaeales archaeon]
MGSLSLNLQNVRSRPETGKIYFRYADIEVLPEYPITPLVELLGGELFLVPSPSPRHQNISRNIEFLMEGFLRKSKRGKVFDAPIDVQFTEEDVVVPDLVFVSNDKLGIIKEKNIRGVPDLIIEILSSNEKHDLQTKKKLYQKHGVQEYWIVDPKTETILLMRLQKGEYVTVGKYGKGKSVQPSIPALEGLTLSVDEIFEP